MALSNSGNLHVTLTADAKSLVSATHEIMTFLDSLKPLTELPPRATELIGQISALSEIAPEQLIRMRAEKCVTDGVRKTVVHLEPAESLMECLAAVRAFTREFKIVNGALQRLQ